jgi:hypothetical protein
LLGIGSNLGGNTTVRIPLPKEVKFMWAVEVAIAVVLLTVGDLIILFGNGSGSSWSWVQRWPVITIEQVFWLPPIEIGIGQLVSLWGWAALLYGALLLYGLGCG